MRCAAPFALALAVAAASGAGCAARTPPPAAPPHVDPDAVAEVRRAPAVVAAHQPLALFLEARQREGDGDARGAAAALQEAVEWDPGDPVLRVALARALSRLGRSGPAADQAAAALRLGPDRATASDAHVLLARAAAARGDGDAAEAQLAQAIALETAAAGPADVAGEVRPEPWRLLAALQLAAGEDEAALRTLEALAVRSREGSLALRGAGRRLLSSPGAPGRAEPFLRRAAAAAPEDPEAHRLLADLHARTGREAEARADLEEVLRRAPDDAAALRRSAELALQAGDAGAALAKLRRLLDAAPDRGAAALDAVRLCVASGRPADALALVQGVRGGGDPALRLAEGLALQALGRDAEAARVLAQVPPGSAGEVEACAARVASLSRLGRHAEAARAADEGLRRAPGSVPLLVARAGALERTGRAAEAAAGLAREAAAREAAGDGEGAVALTAAQAELQCRAGRPRDAVAVLRAAAALHPDAPPLLLGLSAALAQAGDAEGALAELRALLALRPGHPEALARLRAAEAHRVPAAPARTAPGVP